MSEWRKHNGKACPVKPGAIVEYKIINDDAHVDYARNLCWEIDPLCDGIYEYRIVESPREPVRSVEYARWSTTGHSHYEEWDSRVHAIAFASGNSNYPFLETIYFEDGVPVRSEFERVK